ncbi:hypothetical protein [Prochlorococcus sp. MIT 1223]|uniref:hypothetical protein n=1 Tax=Prochlorococcus sp. MIT 1223 TaxID=3096217 RepID=UPI002A750310|nr:hypothetical protein [Prochlorococcus sp. MIT 1223]
MVSIDLLIKNAMHPFTREFFQLIKINEYSDLLEDTDWGIKNLNKVVSPLYSDLLEDTDWT